MAKRWLDQALSAIQTKAQKFLRKFIRKTGLRATGAGRRGAHAAKPGGVRSGNIWPLAGDHRHPAVGLGRNGLTASFPPAAGGNFIGCFRQYRPGAGTGRRSARRFLAVFPRDQAAAVAFTAGSDLTSLVAGERRRCFGRRHPDCARAGEDKSPWGAPSGRDNLYNRGRRPEYYPVFRRAGYRRRRGWDFRAFCREGAHIHGAGWYARRRPL